MPRPHTEYVIREVPIDDLHSAEYEPASRTEPSASMKRLTESIRDIGLQYPPLVTQRRDSSGYDLVDGHRRTAAARQLKWDTMPVLVSLGKPADLFSAVSGTTKPITAADWVGIYLSGGHLPKGVTRSQIMKLEDAMGRAWLEQLAGAGLSPTIWSVSNRMLTYTGLAAEQRRPVIQWLFEHRLNRQVSAWISQEASKEELRAALAENRLPSLMTRTNGTDDKSGLF